MRITNNLRLVKDIRDELLELSQKSSKNIKVSDYLLWIFKERDFTISGISKYFEKKRIEAIDDANKFFGNDYAKLGPEIHAATYTLKLGGQCRIHGSSRWISLENRDIKQVLPQEKRDDFFVEGLDLSKTVIKYDGISNIENCSKLKTLYTRNGPFIDDWFLRKVAHTFSDTLNELDISGCPLVTDNGLVTLGYLRNLKKLNLENLTGVKNKEFISILLEEEIENLSITGSEHLKEEKVKELEKNMSVKSIEKPN